MKRISSFFINLFRTSKASLGAKKKFGEDALKRVATQNAGGAFDALLTLMEAVQTALFGAITNVATKKAISEARTQSVNLVIKQFTSRNTRLNKFLEAADVHKTPVYQEFFPQGVMEFTRNVTKEDVQQKLDLILTAITNHTGIAGGQTVVDEYNEMRDNYLLARGEQLTKLSEVSSGIDQRMTAEEAWDDAMFHAVLFIADKNRDKPQKARLYFNESILRAPQSEASDGKGRIAGIFTQGGEPKENIKVHVVDANVDDVTTDEDGNYTTPSMAIGSYVVQFLQGTTVLHQATVEVVDDGDTLHDVDTEAA